MHLVSAAVTKADEPALLCAEHPRHELRRGPTGCVVVDPDEKVVLIANPGDDLDDDLSGLLRLSQPSPNFRVVRGDDDQTHSTKARIRDASGDTDGIVLVRKCPMDLNAGVEGLRDPLESGGKPSEKRRLPANHDHLDPQNPMVALGERLLVSEAPGGPDDLVDRLRRHVPARIQDPLDSRRSDPRLPRNIR